MDTDQSAQALAEASRSDPVKRFSDKHFNRAVRPVEKSLDTE
jgi:hypothetical protein